MIFSEFWWGWVYGTVLTFAGLLIALGGFQWWRERRRRQRSILTTYSVMHTKDFFDKLHGGKSVRWYDNLPSDDEADEKLLEADEKLLEELEEQEHGKQGREQR